MQSNQAPKSKRQRCVNSKKPHLMPSKQNSSANLSRPGLVRRYQTPLQGVWLSESSCYLWSCLQSRSIRWITHFNTVSGKSSGSGGLLATKLVARSFATHAPTGFRLMAGSRCLGDMSVPLVLLTLLKAVRNLCYGCTFQTLTKEVRWMRLETLLLSSVTIRKSGTISITSGISRRLIIIKVYQRIKTMLWKGLDAKPSYSALWKPTTQPLSSSSFLW